MAYKSSKRTREDFKRAEEETIALLKQPRRKRKKRKIEPSAPPEVIKLDASRVIRLDERERSDR